MKSKLFRGRNVEFLESVEELRAIYGEPSELVRRKALPRLDEHCRNFIARAPFLCLSTAAADGSADISPRGDAPGFVRVLDDQTLLIPDRLGNNRIDSLSNIVCNPHIGLLFLIPGIEETLRVHGLGRIISSSEILAESAVNGKSPRTAIVVEVRETFLQCAKALKRSRLWSEEAHIDRTELPSLGKILVDQTGCSISVADLEQAIEQAYREKLY